MYIYIYIHINSDEGGKKRKITHDDARQRRKIYTLAGAGGGGLWLGGLLHLDCVRSVRKIIENPVD